MKSLEALIAEHLETGSSNITISWMESRQQYHAMSANWHKPKGEQLRDGWGRTPYEAVSQLCTITENDIDDLLG